MKVLLIEDDSFFQKFYSLKLKEQGIEIEVAINGEEGLQKVTTFKPNVILLDLIMPKIDGFTFLQMYNGNKQIQHVPIIVFSTLGQEADVKKAMSLGAKDYVNKSFFDFNTLLAKIKNIVQ